MAFVSQILPVGVGMTFGVHSWRNLEIEMRHWSNHIGRLADRSGGVRTMSGDGVLGPMECCLQDSSGQTVCRPCGDEGVPILLVGVAVAVAGLIYGIGAGLSDLFNATDDDRARNEIKQANCESIVSKSDAHWIAEFKKMLSGPTGDDDENAMLKVLTCLPPDRVRNVVHHFGLQDFMDEFQGSEFDKLVLRLHECGLLRFSDWDDDATRLFVFSLSKPKLMALSIGDIVTLCKNLFAGSCGDDDERAIIRLIQNQTNRRIKKVLEHISIDEFDDNVDGEEWDILGGILLTAQLDWSS
jgi:hypothetical protein